MKAHLARMHKETYDVCIQNDINLRKEKKVKTVRTIVPDSATQTQTVASMFGKQSAAYPSMSNEQVACEQDFTNWFVEMGLPYRIVDGPAFRKIFKRMDPKFTVPGKSVRFISQNHAVRRQGNTDVIKLKQNNIPDGCLWYNECFFSVNPLNG